MKHIKSWAQDGLQSIRPPTEEEFPEGLEALGYIIHTVGEYTHLVEFGCGRGRIAGLFDYYVGYDVNEIALKMAANKHPQHKFQMWKPFDELEKGDVCLAHTVLLHIEDEMLSDYVQVLTNCAQKVIVSEIMIRDLRQELSPRPAYNRNLLEYVRVFEDKGYEVTSAKDFHYSRYNQPLTVAVFERKQQLIK